jgi:hypothetical protein
VNSMQWKAASAVIGASGVLAMGALTLAFSDVSNAQPEPAPPGPVATSVMSTGETSTVSSAPAAAETSVPPEG